MRNIKEERILLYHGSSRKIDRFKKGILFLTYDMEEAIAFSQSVHMFNIDPNISYVYSVSAKPGKTNDSDDIILDFIMENENPIIDDVVGYDGEDIDRWIEKRYAPYLRNQGYRYFTFSHPSAVSGDEFVVTVSLYPNSDLTIVDEQGV